MGNAEILVGLRDMILGAMGQKSIYFVPDTEEEFQDFMNELCSISDKITENWNKNEKSIWIRNDFDAANVEDIYMEYDPTTKRIYWDERRYLSTDTDVVYIRDLYASSQCDVCDSQYDIGFLL